jgi:hypothetical protein
MAELVVSAGTIAQLKRVADERGTTAEELAEQAIRQFLRDEKRRLMQQESAAFQAMHAELLVKYPGEYVAIHQGQMVDHDPDQLTLFTRIEAQYPDVPVLIRQVLPEPEEIYTIWSPRIVNG